MATLVLSSVGTILGGPLGGALGSLVGQAIDQQLFAPKAKRGPRLGDLSVQTSSFGSPIPRIYGAMRVAGTVVWATDLRETEVASGGGKGSPRATRASYSCSFAVALSSRRLIRVGRIWADGKLLRGAAGDFKTPCTFRFHDGSESQAVDPLIAAAEGATGTPAYRGIALAVFENLALADFGNRIPMLTFEVIADEGPVRVARLLSDATNGVIADDGLGEGPTLAGYAAHGRDQRGAIEPLIALFDIMLADSGGSLAQAPTGPAQSVGAAETSGCSADGRAMVARGEREQEPARALPASLTLGYYEAARDYQAGQLAASVGGGGREQWRLDLPAVLDASTAKALAQTALARRWARRDRLRLRLAPRFFALQPGRLVNVDGRAGLWRVAEVKLEAMVVLAELVRTSEKAPAPLADPGRATREEDVAIGATRLALIDLPDMSEVSEPRLRLHLIGSAAGGFRPVPVRVTVNGQPGPDCVIARRGVLGTALTTLAGGPSALRDDSASVEVVLVAAEQMLLNADEDALAMGANLALIGHELIQFAQAEQVAPGRYRLTRLLRGRRGTEWAIDGHGAGESFLVIDAASLVAIDLDPAMRGAEVVAEAFGVADDPVDPPGAVARAEGEALRPPSPCALTARFQSNGDLRIGWLRRRRERWAWADAVSDPETEDAAFLVRLAGTAGSLERPAVGSGATITAADIATLGAGALTLDLVESGGLLQSRPARRIVA